MNKSVGQWLSLYRRKRFSHSLLVQGLVLGTLALLLWLAFLLAETFGYFSPQIKSFLWVASLLVVSIYAFLKGVLPVFQWFRGTYYSLTDCALEIGKKFPEIDDKLLNAYQLEQMGSSVRIQQAVEERLQQAIRFPIWQSFSWSTVRPYVFGFATLVGILFALSQYTPTQEAQNRLFSWNERFLPPPPFEVDFDLPKKAEEGERVRVHVKPLHVQVASFTAEVNGEVVFGSKQADGSFDFIARMGAQDQSWVFAFGEYTWEPKTVHWIPAVAWNSISLRVVPPAYTGEPARTVTGLQDLDCPSGTLISWKVDADHAHEVRWKINGKQNPVRLAPFEGVFRLETSTVLELQARSSQGKWKSGGRMNVRVQPDNPPLFSVEWNLDSVRGILQATWKAEDDWGLGKVVIGRSEQRLGKAPAATGSQEISLRGSREDWFAYAVDTRGQKSAVVAFTKPRFAAQDQQVAQGARIRAMAQQSSMTRKTAQKITQTASEERRRQTQRKNETTDRLQREAEEDIKAEMRKEMEAMKKALQTLKMPQADTKAQEKQWEEERKALENLMEQLQKQELNPSAQKIALSMERLEALLEKLIKEQQQLMAIQSLEKLAEDQKRLAEQSRPDEQKAQQEIAEETQELAKENEEEVQEAAKDQEELKEQKDPSNSDQAKASESLKKAAEKMRKNLLESQKSETEKEIRSLKQLIDNLLQLSFGLEKLSDKTSAAVPTDPGYAFWQKELQRTQEGLRLVADTLRAIGMRRPDIGAKTSELTQSLLDRGTSAKGFLKERQGPNAGVQLQMAMKEANDLAVLFQEALNNAQQQMSSMKKDGTGSCSKPGSGKPSAAGMRKMQGQLAEQMKSLGQRPGQQPGQQPGATPKEGQGQKQPGASGSAGEGAQRAALLAQQERLRRELEKTMGNSPGGREASELMKELERQLVKNAPLAQLQQTIKRLDIKLLELERAEKKEDEDEKRESEVAKERMGDQTVLPPAIFKPKTLPLYRGWPLFQPDYTPKK